MAWFLKEKIMEELSRCPERKAWAESGAFEAFFEIEKNLDTALLDRARVGALGFKEIEGALGLHAWMMPIDGYPKILGKENRVKLLEKDGRIFFEGKWGETTFEMIESHLEFFIYLPPREGKEVQKPDWKTRAIGAFRYFKNRHRKGR